MYLIYILIALTIKFTVISKYSSEPIISYLFYFAYFYVLHECTQIRIAVAIAFYLIALVFFAKRQQLKANIIIFAACFFHYSALAFFIMNMFLAKKLHLSRYFYVLIGFIMVSLLNVNISLLILNSLNKLNNIPIFHKLFFYINLAISNNSVEPLIKLKSLLLLAVLGFIFVYAKKIKMNYFELLCFKSTYIALILYIIFRTIPHLSVRLSEMFMFPMIFLMPLIISQVKQKKIILFMMIALALMFFMYYIYLKHVLINELII